MARRPSTSGLLTVAEAAAELGVSPATVRRASDAGVIPCRRSPGGHRRFEQAALEGLTRDRLLRAGRDRGGGERDILRALADLGEAAGRWERIDDLLTDVAHKMLAATDAATCDIYKLEDEGVFRCLVSLDRDGLDEAATGMVLRTDVYQIDRQAVRDGKVVVVNDRRDPRMRDADRLVFDEYGFESEVIIPLLVQERVVGLIELYGDRPRMFASSLEYARSAGHLVAGALEKALLLNALEDRGRVLKELFDLAQLLSQVYDVEQLLRTVATRLLEAVQAVHCDIYQIDGDGCRCVVSAGLAGFLESYEGSLLDLADNPTSAKVFAERRALIVADVEDSELSEKERASLLAQGLRSELCIPLVVKEETVGLIDLFGATPRDWRECIEFAAGVGQLVAGAIENADLLARLEGRNRDLRTLVEGGLEFSSTLDTERVLLTIARRMRVATAAAACDIFALEGSWLRALVSVDDDDSADKDFAGGEFAVADFPLTSLALRTGRPVSVDDVVVDARANALERKHWAEDGFRSGVIVPLFNGTHIVGVTLLYSREAQSFGQLDLLRGLSQIAGQAIVNARLYSELDRSASRARLLNEVSAELSGTLDTHQLLRMVVERVRSVADVSECSAYLVVGGGRVECVATSALGEPSEGIVPGMVVGLERWPVTRLVIETRRAAAITSLDDVRVDAASRAWLAAHGVRSYLVVPLIARGVVAGTLELTETRRERDFTGDDFGLVEAVCRVAGLAMDNALLFGDLERRSREAELVNEIARRTTASLDLGEIAEATVAGLSHLTPIASYSLALMDQGGLSQVYGSQPPEDARAAWLTGDAVGGAFERLRRERVVIFDGGDGGPAPVGHPAASGASSAAIGLFDQHILIGVLMLGGASPGAFSVAEAGLLERVGVHLSLAANNARLYQEIKTLHLSNLKGLSTALNAKDYYTLGHAARVAAYTVLLGEELGWEPVWIEQVREAAYLHDIGKIGVSDRVLVKQGPLNAEEWELMRQHPAVSAEIIKPLFPAELVTAVRHHHERYDGKGYPDGLAGAEIPELARALCVVDSYDAMSLQRPYRAARAYDDCVAELQACRGAQFDPGMTDAFLRVLEHLAALRGEAVSAAAEAAGRIDPERHAKLRDPQDEAAPEYAEVQRILREARDAHRGVRYVTTSASRDGRTVIVVDAEDPESPERSPLGEEVRADDAILQVLSGREILSNVLFVDRFGVWVNGLVPLVGEGGEIVAAVVADAPALSSSGARGFARMTTETPVSTLQEAAVRLSRAEIEAITDGLTGLYNHRYLHESLSEELSRARHDSHCAALLFCDLDFFKDYNDRLGHAAGDSALRATARIIESCTRRADLVARYGGEEFVVVLPRTAEPEAVEIAGRIRAAVAEYHLENGGLTISIGVATYPAAAETKEGLLEAADRALYIAKRLGRDRVVAAGPAAG
jgi:diguanylate cyclase (GGDEF)-like protein/excisionase family DNA binding protein